jgi:hypothetical protein
VLSRSPSSDGVAVLLDTLNRLLPAVACADKDTQLLNAYAAEGHLRLVEVTLDVATTAAAVAVSNAVVAGFTRSSRCRSCHFTLGDD